jgi:hypothetical protein
VSVGFGLRVSQFFGLKDLVSCLCQFFGLKDLVSCLCQFSGLDLVSQSVISGLDLVSCLCQSVSGLGSVSFSGLKVWSVACVSFRA